MKNPILAALVLTIVVAGCKTPKDETEDSQPTATAEQAVEAAETKEEPAAPAEPEAAEPDIRTPVKIAGTPHDQEHTKVTLTSPKDQELALYRSPGVVSGSTGKLELKEGDNIKFADSWMFVRAPSVVVAKEGAELQGAASHEPRSGKTSEGMRNIPVEAGAEVSIYKVAAEGTCYVGVGDDYYLSTCPSRDKFEGDDDDFAGPTEYEWWVLATPESGDGGWFEVDDRVKVNVKSTM